MAFGDLGDYRGAAHGMRRLVGFSEGTRRGGPGIAAIRTRAWLTVFLAALGEFPEAQQRADEALAIAESVGFDFSLMRAYLDIGRVHAHRVAPTLDPILERGLAIGRPVASRRASLDHHAGWRWHTCKSGGRRTPSS